jgi:hypothetical protein
MKDKLGRDINPGDLVMVAYTNSMVFGIVVRINPLHYVDVTKWGITTATNKMAGKSAKWSYIIGDATYRTLIIPPSILTGQVLEDYKTIKRILDGNTGN